jgi:hypothetical protein
MFKKRHLAFLLHPQGVKSKNDDYSKNERLKDELEVRGIEPLTFCMQSRRSAN